MPKRAMRGHAFQIRVMCDAYNLRLSLKLQLMVALAVAGIAAVAILGLGTLRANLLEDRKAKLGDLVQLARQAVETDYQAAMKSGLGTAEAEARAKVILRNFKFGASDYFFAFDKDAVIVVHANPKLEGVSYWNVADPDGVFFAREMIAAAAQGGGYVAYRFPRAGEGAPLPKLSYALPFAPYAWTIAGGVYIDDVDDIFWSQAVSVALLAALALLVVGAASLLLGRNITRPISTITAAMHSLAAGNKTVAIGFADRRDEIGALAQSFKIFRDNAVRLEAAENERRAAEAHAAKERHETALMIAEEFEKTMSAVANAVSGSSAEMQNAAGRMQNTADATSKQSAVVATASEQASSNVYIVAAAAEEMAAAVSEITGQVTNSTSIVQGAVGETQRADEMIRSLANATTKIGEVVQLINDIASQTNLLALNATIEAARAGEAGKGFSVLASEVKALANQTGRATEEIAGQIASIQAETQSAVAAMKSIGSTINEINEVSTTIASAVEEQGAATREITRNTQLAADGTGDVSSNIAGVSRGATDTGELASLVLSTATELEARAEKLRAEVDQFLRGIRAA